MNKETTHQHPRPNAFVFAPTGLYPSSGQATHRGSSAFVRESPFAYRGFLLPSDHPTIEAKPIAQARAEMLEEGAYEIFLSTFDSDHRLGAFLGLAPQLSDELFWSLLRFVWTNAEVTLPQKETWLELLNSKRPLRNSLMICSERRLLARLPAVVTVYRGCGSREGVHGLSWTLDDDRAKFFAHYACGPRRFVLCPNQHGKTPIVVKGHCSKNDVLAYFGNRKEDEIVVDPSKVTVTDVVERHAANRHLRGT